MKQSQWMRSEEGWRHAGWDAGCNDSDGKWCWIHDKHSRSTLVNAGKRCLVCDQYCGYCCFQRADFASTVTTKRVADDPGDLLQRLWRDASAGKSPFDRENCSWLLRALCNSSMRKSCANKLHLGAPQWGWVSVATPNWAPTSNCQADQSDHIAEWMCHMNDLVVVHKPQDSRQMPSTSWSQTSVTTIGHELSIIHHHQSISIYYIEPWLTIPNSAFMEGHKGYTAAKPFDMESLTWQTAKPWGSTGFRISDGFGKLLVPGCYDDPYLEDHSC